MNEKDSNMTKTLILSALKLFARNDVSEVMQLNSVSDGNKWQQSNVKKSVYKQAQRWPAYKPAYKHHFE